jgi:Pyruvate/2-oxoacid:ferredoxin oxidoreductase gamma subunit
VKAADIAKRLGNIKVANSVVLGALFTALCDGYLRGEDKNDFSAVFEEAIIQQFKNKTEVIELNLEAFRLGSTSVVRH